MPTYNTNIPSQIVVQTAAQWAADATVYSAKRILVTSDAFYGTTNVRKIKIADGTLAWSALNYFPGADLATIGAIVLTGFAAGANLTVLATDTIAIALGKFQGQISARVVSNVSIGADTKTKITYDSKGLVTAGADATTADIPDSSNKRYVTDANLTVIGNTSGTNTGNETAASIATINHSTAAKTTLVDADEITGQDSANSFSLIRTTWTNVKAFLKTYFDTLYASKTFVESISLQDSSTGIAAQTYTLELYAAYAYTINELKIICDSGTCTAAVKINGSSVTSISAVSVSSTIATGTASGANTVAVGDKITLVITSPISLNNLQASLKTTRI